MNIEKHNFETEEMFELYKFYEHKQPDIINCKHCSDESTLAQFFSTGNPIVYSHQNTYNDKSLLCDKLSIAIGGNTNVPIRYGNYANPKEYAFNRLVKQLPFEKFIKNYFLDEEDNDFHYLGNFEISKSQQEAIGIISPKIYSPNDVSTAALWICKRGCITPLHCDGPDSFVYQLYGTKKWKFFTPADYPFLDSLRPSPLKYPSFFCSSIDLRHETVN